MTSLPLNSASVGVQGTKTGGRERAPASWVVAAVLASNLLAGVFLSVAVQHQSLVGSWQSLGALGLGGRAVHRLLTVLDVTIALIIVGAITIERVLPADPEQPAVSSGVREDALWMLMGVAFHLGTFALLYTFMNYLWIHVVGGHPGRSLEPRWLAWVLALLTVDLLTYVNHRFRHREPALWAFHSVHHSQRQLNVFTDYRVHFVDYFAINAPMLIPTFFFGFNFMSVVVARGLMLAHTGLYHANIRSNYGILRYVLVTPQSHRIHHSTDARHFNRNYGSLFSVWDHLFGTQYRTYDEYPLVTGINDPAFPTRGVEPGGTIRAYAAQLAYPFEVIVRTRRARVAGQDFTA